MATGAWSYSGPDGTDYNNHSVFVEVVKPERIVFDHVSGPHFQVTATLDEQAGKTLLTFRMAFKSAAEYDKVKSYAVEANEQNFDRLEAQLVLLEHYTVRTHPRIATVQAKFITIQP